MSDIRVPTDWLKDKGIKTISSDNWVCFDEQTFIVSFADRENTGEQPVADWVPVIATYKNGRESDGLNAYGHGWPVGDGYNYLEKWKPNIKALYEIYLAEQKVWLNERNGVNGLGKKLIDGERKLDMFINRDPPPLKIKKPIYTKEMKEAGENPVVGMISNIIIDSDSKDRVHHDEAVITYIGDGILCFKTKVFGEIAFIENCCSRVIHKPIETKTDKELAIDTAVSAMSCLMLDGLSPKGLLKTIINGDIPGVKWVVK